MDCFFYNYYSILRSKTHAALLALLVLQGCSSAETPAIDSSTSTDTNTLGVSTLAGTAPPLTAVNPVAVDSSGTIYAADANNHTILKITAAGVVTILAGSPGVSGSTDGTGSAARFNSPSAIAVDSSGNVYVADTGNSTVRTITAAGVVTTLAGTVGVSTSVNGTGTAASFDGPLGLAVDSSGNVFVAEANSQAIRKITPAGVVTTFAGTVGAAGTTDDTGSAARFSGPIAIAIHSSGNMYVADYGNYLVRKITAAGVVTTFAGSGSLGTVDGAGAAAEFNNIYGVSVDSSENVYVADYGNHNIRKITAAGVVTTFAGTTGVAGSTDATGTAASFTAPVGVAIDNAGNLYVADSGNITIRKVTPLGVVTSLTAMLGHADGTGADARFNGPTGVAVDSSGNVYVADQSNHIIRKITPEGVVTTWAGTAGVSGSTDGTGAAARFTYPVAVTMDESSNLYVADSGNNTIRKITPEGVVTTLAGTARVTGDANGTGAAASFNALGGIASDSSGNLYVVDIGSNTVRKITAAGVVTTLAGTVGVPGSTDATGTAASFNTPYGIAVDPSGDLYVTDTGNNAIRKITAAGVVTTLAGTASPTGGNADGTGAAASFGGPAGVTVDSSGNVYVTDMNSYTIRKITAAGVVTTVAGAAGVPGSTDATVGTDARFYVPYGLGIDSSGNLYIADMGNQTIRKFTLTEE